jgi:hypothetical protein
LVFRYRWQERQARNGLDDLRFVLGTDAAE